MERNVRSVMQLNNSTCNNGINKRLVVVTKNIWNWNDLDI